MKSNSDKKMPPNMSENMMNKSGQKTHSSEQAMGSSIRGSSTTSQGNASLSPSVGTGGVGAGEGMNKNQGKGQGRGWHGDPQGHAKAGSQSHKNSSTSSNRSSGSKGSSGSNA